MIQERLLTIITVSAFEDKRLSKTIDSCRNIDFQFEHLFVIPKGDLIGLNLIKQYKRDVDFRVEIVNDDNKGIYAAMNLGINAAWGEYLIFINSGDEIYSSSVFKKNLVNIQASKPIWAITGVNLPWNPSYESYVGMEKKFRRQQSLGYICHQSIFTKKMTLKTMNGFDVNFPIAADTKKVFVLSNSFKPLILEGIAIKIEPGANVTLHNRESRIEVLKIIKVLHPRSDQIFAYLNFIIREIHFFSRHTCRKLRLIFFKFKDIFVSHRQNYQ